MNHVIVAGKSEQITMSSREIADLCNKRHDHVMTDIRKMLSELDLHAPDFTGTYKTTQGNEYECFNLPRRECDILVAGYSIKYRAAIIDRWQELEQQAAQPSFQIPASLSEALRLAADQAEQIEQQQVLIEQQKPAVQFVDQYVESTGLKGFRQVAKLLKANERELRDFLISHKIMYRIGGEWTAYQNHIDAGRFQSKTGTNETNGHAYTRAMFTPKGVNWLAGLWAQYQISKQEGEAA